MGLKTQPKTNFADPIQTQGGVDRISVVLPNYKNIDSHRIVNDTDEQNISVVSAIQTNRNNEV